MTVGITIIVRSTQVAEDKQATELRFELQYREASCDPLSYSVSVVDCLPGSQVDKRDKDKELKSFLLSKPLPVVKMHLRSTWPTLTRALAVMVVKHTLYSIRNETYKHTCTNTYVHPSLSMPM